MQVLRWLLRVANDNPIKKKEFKEDDKKEKLVCYKEKRVSKKTRKTEETSLDCKNFRQKQQHHYIISMKMKKDNKQDSSTNVGNKVLPISDSSTTSSTMSNDDDQKQCGPFDPKIKGESNGNKTKTLSRMKELLRWASNAKLERGGKFGRKVLHLKNRSATIKSERFDEEESSYDSPKISFRWEVESVSTTCSAVSAPPCLKYDDHPSSTPHKFGNWITTDDEFVVLEL